MKKYAISFLVIISAMIVNHESMAETCYFPNNRSIYCTATQISSGICGNNAIEYSIDSESGAFIVGGQYYAKMADVSGNNPLNEEQLTALRAQNSGGNNSLPKAKRLYYTPTEAAQHVNHTNNNKITFTFK